MSLSQSWVEMQALVAWRKQNEVWQKIRADQNAFWFNTELRQALLTRLENDPEAAAASSAMQKAIRAGEVAPSVAAERVVQSFLRTKKNVV